MTDPIVTTQDYGMRFDVKPSPLLFVNDGRPILTISPDLVLSLGDGVTVEEAAKGFVEIVNNNLQSRIRELESKLAACRPSAEAVAARECWRPIETAPKNGEYILMLRGTTVRTARWFDDWMFGESAWGAPGWSYPKDDQPTHWMPMPAPPAGECSK